MASSFDRWEKDPFFSAAEEVQESADRMQSTYRTWLHAKSNAAGEWNLEELRRDLYTVVGTTKWQLEEFERAVRSSYAEDFADDSKDRHRDFIIAIEDQVSRVQNSLHESAVPESKNQPSWARLDEGESNELALFLTGLSAPNENPRDENNRLLPDGIKSLSHSSEKSYELRRIASADADIDAWKIAIPDDSHWRQNLSNSGQPPRKIPSLSSFLNPTDSSPSKSKWPRNEFRKLKAIIPYQESDSASTRLCRQEGGINTCYDRNKSCLDSCDDCYDKQLYGWYGALQRQLQRSQYQMRYNRPAQLTFSAVLLCLIFLITLHVI